jgi:protein-S-isoprenylcysteine O-methyltransferase Ste14
VQDESRRPRTLILPPVPFAAALFGGWWLDRNGWPLPLGGGQPGEILGWLLTLAGLALFIWALVTLYRHHTTVNPYHGASHLCTDGPFRFSRNPIYLGDWLLLAGVALILDTAWPWLFAPLIWGLIRFGVIRHEEAHLALRFGAAYREYQARVRRWL